ncbi:MAG: hypothetical protein ACFBSE_12545 [Prochloraceae cyanobacterium]
MIGQSIGHIADFRSIYPQKYVCAIAKIQLPEILIYSHAGKRIGCDLIIYRS